MIYTVVTHQEPARNMLEQTLIIFYTLPILLTTYRLEIDCQGVDLLTGDEWLIHGPKLYES